VGEVTSERASGEINKEKVMWYMEVIITILFPFSEKGVV
jgi:hypothetical protein